MKGWALGLRKDWPLGSETGWPLGFEMGWVLGSVKGSGLHWLPPEEGLRAAGGVKQGGGHWKGEESRQGEVEWWPQEEKL